MTFSTTVILPALNEADALPAALVGRPTGMRVVVVDNGSTDSTAEVAASLGVEVVSQPQPGYGSACVAGIDFAAGSDVLVLMDADATCDWSDLPSLLAPFEQGADLVLGVRSPRLREEGSMPFHVAIANVFLGRLCARLGGQRVRDIPPYRAIRADALQKLQLKDRTFGWPLEMVLRAGQMNMKIVEVPVRYRRRVGTSKVTGTAVGTLRAVFRMSIVLWRHRSPGQSSA